MSDGIVSSYDDPTSVDAFLNFMKIKADPTSLRGGERVVSQPFSEGSVEILDYDEVHDQSPQDLYTRPRDYRSVPPPNDPAAQGRRTPSPPVVPLQQHELSKASYPTATPAKATPVVSIARRRVEHKFDDVSSTEPSKNRLDTDPVKEFMTPTQRRVLEAMKADDQQIAAFFAKKAATTDDVSVDVEDCEAKVEQLPRVKSARKLDPQVAEFDMPKVEPAHEEHDVCIDKTPSQMHDDKTEQTTSHELVDSTETSTNVSDNEADAPPPPPPPPQEDDPEARQETGHGSRADEQASRDTDIKIKQEEEDNDDAKSEGGIDLTPIMKALRSRSPIKHERKSSVHVTSTPDTSPEFSEKGTRTTNDLKDNGELEEQHKDDTDTPKKELAEGRQDQPANQQISGAHVDTRSEYRTIVIRNLPEAADYTIVQSLVYGGQIESMHLDRQKRAAQITFTSASDCDRYTKAIPDGSITFKLQKKNHTASVELSKKPDQYDSRLQAFVDCGASRVIKAENILEDMSMRELEEKARGPSSIREVEAIYASYRGGCHTVIFRFTNILDAVSFKGVLSRIPELKKGLQFGEDPCAEADGPYHE